jgi:hypothetical protein
MSDPHDPRDPQDPRGPDDVGSVGEEAARLLGALSDWARDSDLLGQATHVLHEVDEHVATGAPECRWCPVCRTVHLARAASPEVRAHLATAAASLMQAVAGVLESLPSAAGGAADAPTQESGVERIDLDDDPEDPLP